MTQEELDSTPICSEHADTWYCARNHIKTDTGCILCDLAIANLALKMSVEEAPAVVAWGKTPEEVIAGLKMSAQRVLDNQTVTLEAYEGDD